MNSKIKSLCDQIFLSKMILFTRILALINVCKRKEQSSVFAIPNGEIHINQWINNNSTYNPVSDRHARFIQLVLQCVLCYV